MGDRIYLNLVIIKFQFELVDQNSGIQVGTSTTLSSVFR